MDNSDPGGVGAVAACSCFSFMEQTNARDIQSAYLDSKPVAVLVNQIRFSYTDSVSLSALTPQPLEQTQQESLMITPGGGAR